MPNDSRSRVLERLLDELDRVLPMRRSLVGIDGFDGAGRTHLAHELAAIAARQSRRPVLNVSLDDFRRPRGIRHRNGRGPESFYRDSYDHAAFISCVVAPLRAGRPITPAVWDVDRDQPVHPTARPVPEDGIVLVDGMFLHRPEVVVLTGEVGRSCEGWLVATGGVGSVVAVGMQPAIELAAASGFGGAAAGMGPAVCRGAVESLDLAVGLRLMRRRPVVRDPQVGAGVSPEVGALGAAIVRLDPFDRDPAGVERLDSPHQDRGGGDRGFVVVDLCVGTREWLSITA